MGWLAELLTERIEDDRSPRTAAAVDANPIPGGQRNATLARLAVAMCRVTDLAATVLPTTLDHVERQTQLADKLWGFAAAKAKQLYRKFIETSFAIEFENGRSIVV